MERLDDKLVSHDGERVADPTKPLFVYFSAHWCPPCRGFTPQLIAFFKRLEGQAELVFVSWDKTQQAFDEYYEDMPWLALPYGEDHGLAELFGVKGIPTLVLLSPLVDGKRKVITLNARSHVAANDIASFPKWEPKPYADLTLTIECRGMDLNDMPAIVVLGEQVAKEKQAGIVDAVQQAAMVNDNLLFYYAMSSGGAVGRVRMILQVPPKETPLMVKFDIPDDGGYYVSDATDITPDTIAAFIANPGPRLQLGD